MPVYALGLVGDYVNISLHKSKKYKGKKVAESVSPDSTMSKQSLPIVSTGLDTISSTSSNSNNRNRDRFSNLLHLLPTQLQGLTHGDNIDEPLNRLEAKGVPLQVTASHLSNHNYTGATNPYAVLISRLKDFSEQATDQVAGRKRIDEQNRLVDEQLEVMRLNKVTEEQLEERLAEARRAIGRG